MDWQTIIALAFVFGTVAAFAYRLARPRKKSGCGKSCGCGDARKK